MLPTGLRLYQSDFDVMDVINRTVNSVINLLGDQLTGDLQVGAGVLFTYPLHGNCAVLLKVRLKCANKILNECRSIAFGATGASSVTGGEPTIFIPFVHRLNSVICREAIPNLGRLSCAGSFKNCGKLPEVQ